MDELKLTGNSLLGSRPLLSFDPVRLFVQKNCNGGFYVTNFIANVCRMNQNGGFHIDNFVPTNPGTSATYTFLVFFCSVLLPHLNIR